MSELKPRIKENGIDYILVGDYYTPDFLILQRKDGVIHKVLIAETKGKIYASDPKFKDKRTFMETEFLRQNNAAFGYERFEYLYLEDSMPERERLVLTQRKISDYGFSEFIKILEYKAREIGSIVQKIDRYFHCST